MTPPDLKNFHFENCVPIEKGGSGRQFFRVILPDGTGAILCRYDASREENALYAPLAKTLAKMNFPVPKIFADFSENGTGAILFEDLGSEDLWALRDAPWENRFAAYASALRALHHLHRDGFAFFQNEKTRLMPAFDAGLYRWERNYFLENCVKNYLKISLSENDTGALEAELSALAERLLRLPTALIHRDCQSQNIIWKNGTACFIDFQGMRNGTAFYDLASLIFDPYVNFSERERGELSGFYFKLGTPFSFADFEQHLRDAAAQRLMQALGAYGFLGISKDKTEFLAHIKPALKNLTVAVEKNPAVPLLKKLVSRAGEIASSF